jgi:hypothetical protein
MRLRPLSLAFPAAETRLLLSEFRASDATLDIDSKPLKNWTET